MARPQKLDEKAVASRLASLGDWRVDGATLVRELAFPSYAAGIAFAVELGFAAEKLDHHPDMLLGYRKVEVRFTTHDASGLTSLDFDMAARVDAIFEHRG